MRQRITRWAACLGLAAAVVGGGVLATASPSGATYYGVTYHQAQNTIYSYWSPAPGAAQFIDYCYVEEAMGIAYGQPYAEIFPLSGYGSDCSSDGTSWFEFEVCRTTCFWVALKSSLPLNTWSTIWGPAGDAPDQVEIQTAYAANEADNATWIDVTP